MNCFAHRLMGTTYAQAPLAFRANSGDLPGGAYYLLSGQIWADSPVGEPLEDQLHPYWTPDISSDSGRPLIGRKNRNMMTAEG